MSPRAGEDVQQGVGNFNLDFGDITFGDKTTPPPTAASSTPATPATSTTPTSRVTATWSATATTAPTPATCTPGRAPTSSAGGIGNDHRRRQPRREHPAVAMSPPTHGSGQNIQVGDIDSSGGGAAGGSGGHGGGGLISVGSDGGNGGAAAGGAGGGVIIAPTQTATTRTTSRPAQRSPAASTRRTRTPRCPSATRTTTRPARSAGHATTAGPHAGDRRCHHDDNSVAPPGRHARRHPRRQPRVLIDSSTAQRNWRGPFSSPRQLARLPL